ncbi:unannotated protein [freshwater metagenome]|uniref:Unannotated protein n=1 Tax=freshwater metagenome TaxID=449393 RepID=A0A6J7NAB8_9ZZZZ
MTPGERTSCDTTTRSVPLITKVPFSVIFGKSPMNTVCSLISPVGLLRNRARTNTGDAYVMSRSRHSATVNFGFGQRSSSSGSNSSSSCRSSENPLIGEMSSNASFNPSLRNHSKLSRCTAMRSGSSRVSGRVANEYRSRADAREATELLLIEKR